MLKKNFYSYEELVTHIQTGLPTLFVSSQTSTVIPYENLEKKLGPKTILGNLSSLKGFMSLDEKACTLTVEGGVTWREARAFCLSKGFEVMTSPTEDMASILSGVATSCTGERSFGFKNLRSQIVSLDYIGYDGQRYSLSSQRPLDCGIDLREYQKSFIHYQHFKNAPFPRLEFETDLLTGTEGQLGVICKAVLKVIKYRPEIYLFISLPRWEKDIKPHLEVFHAVQSMRSKIFACEFLDANSLSYLDKSQRLGQLSDDRDYLFLEIAEESLENVSEELLTKLDLISADDMLVMSQDKCREIRMGVPRAIFESNTRMGVTKKGTDVQVAHQDFEKLLEYYREMAKKGIRYNLFGHFGDAHLHFNYMPTLSEVSFAEKELEELYKMVYVWQGSPFAEHGIGLLKQKFIERFLTATHKNVFRKLKLKYDPKNQFFPEGFMSC